MSERLFSEKRFLPLVFNERVSDCVQSGNRLALSLPLYSNQADEESKKEKARTIPPATLGVGVSS